MHDVPMPARVQPPRRASDLTRRIRDLLRAEIVSDRFAGGVLPTEEELRAAFDAPRAAVREALNLLQEEGLLSRVRGQGTFVTSRRVRQVLEEMHGVSDPTGESIWNGRMNTKILDWSDVPATPPIARMLQVEVGTTVLRIDYVAKLGDIAIGTATNHLTYPEAESLSPDLIRVDFYDMLHRAGVEVGESTFLFDSSKADEYDAALLDISLGSPVMVIEQMIYAPDGHPIDAALCRASHRSMFFSRAGRTTA